jgi:hypothetical protein
MTTLEKIKSAMLDVYSINEDTRQKVKNAFDVETLIEILSREYPQMARAICFLRIIDILKNR